MTRFRIEERVGVIVIYDIQHPEYEDETECHVGFPSVVASWHGYYDKDRWKIWDWQKEKAKKLCDMLNQNIKE